MNRRGFLASLAALALAPKLAPAAKPSLPLRVDHVGPGRYNITGLAGWLPVACVVAARFCPPDAVYIIGDEARMDWKVDGEVQFFGLERGKPVIIAHPSHADELRAAVADAVARVQSATDREMFA